MRHLRELQQLTIDGGHEVVATLDLSPTWGGARKGAGRPSQGVKTKSVSVRLPLAVVNALGRVAKSRGQSNSEYLKDMIIRELTLDIDTL